MRAKSALILSEMPPAEALLTLHLMHSTAQSQLLGKLPPEQAAVYTVLLKDLEQSSNNMPLLQAANEVIAPYEDLMREVARRSGGMGTHVREYAAVRRRCHFE